MKKRDKTTNHVYIYIYIYTHMRAQSAVAVEYTDCFSAEG